MEENMENRTGAQGNESEEKLFTQEQVNEIIKRRLGRQKEQDNTQELETRTQELNAFEQELRVREQELENSKRLLECKEYLKDREYPEKFLDLIDTSDVSVFKRKADEIYHYTALKIQGGGPPLASTEGSYVRIDRRAFEKTAHTPRHNYWEPFNTNFY